MERCTEWGVMGQCHMEGWTNPCYYHEKMKKGLISALDSSLWEDEIE